MGGSDSRHVLGRDIDFSGHHQNAPYFDIGGFSLIDVGRLRRTHHATDWLVAFAGLDCGDLSA
jgi:hypothetical protein